MKPTNPTPRSCPKWESCTAPTCPLAPGYGADCKTLNGDPVCLWLREGMKPGGFDRMPADLAPTIRKAIPVLLETGGSVLRGKLKRAESQGSGRPPHDHHGDTSRA